MSGSQGKWQTTTSGELCEYITSGSRDWKSYYSENGALFVRTQDINQDRLDLPGVAHVALPEKVEGKRSRIQAGDLLVTITGANVGKVALVPEEIPEAYVSQSVGLLRLKDTRSGPYLYYYLQSDKSGRKHLSDMVYGIGRPVLSLQNLRDIPVPLPPLPEQRRIVAKIEELFTRLDAGVAALQAVKQQIKRYRQAVLRDAFTGKLTEEWRERELRKRGEHGYREAGPGSEGRTARANNDIPFAPACAMPRGWSAVVFGQVLADIQYGTARKCTHTETPSATPVLRIPNVAGGRVSHSDMKYAELTEEERVTYRLQAGNVLIIRSNGSVSLVGRPAMVTDREAHCAFAGYLLRLRIRTEAVLPDFIVPCLESPFVRNQIEGMARSTSGVNNINTDEVRSLAFWLPPLDEQSAIAAEIGRHFSLADFAEKAVDVSLTKAEHLRQSILKQAFEGRLVPQDPNDEPAEKLLARIRGTAGTPGQCLSAGN